MTKHVTAGERKWVVDHKLHNQLWHQLSIILLLHKTQAFPLTSMHSLSLTATGTFSTALVVWSFPKAPSLLAASFSTHIWRAHHPVAHETNVSSCARKQAPRVDSHYHERNRREIRLSDVGVLAEIGDGDLKKGRLTMPRQGKKKLSTANSEILHHDSTWRSARARQRGGSWGTDTHLIHCKTGKTGPKIYPERRKRMSE